MQITLPCDTYVRLSRIAAIADEPFKAIYIERKGALTVAIATNRRIAAIEQIPDASEDGSLLLVCDDALIKQSITETGFNSNIQIVSNPVLGFTNAKTTLGYNHPGNAELPDVAPEWSRWRTWLPPEEIKTSKSGMFWSGENIAALAAAAPSGKIVFPNVIDCGKPVVVRDYVEDRWFGLFMPNVKTDKGEIIECDAAKVPGWCK